MTLSLSTGRLACGLGVRAGSLLSDAPCGADVCSGHRRVDHAKEVASGSARTTKSSPGPAPGGPGMTGRPEREQALHVHVLLVERRTPRVCNRPARFQ